VKDFFLTDAGRNLSEGDKRTHELMVNLLFSIPLFHPEEGSGGCSIPALTIYSS
jgi:hypothetical protein